MQIHQKPAVRHRYLSTAVAAPSHLPAQRRDSTVLQCPAGSDICAPALDGPQLLDQTSAVSKDNLPGVDVAADPGASADTGGSTSTRVSVTQPVIYAVSKVTCLLLASAVPSACPRVGEVAYYPPPAVLSHIAPPGRLQWARRAAGMCAHLSETPRRYRLI